MNSLTFFGVFFLVALTGGLGAVIRLYAGRWQGKLPWGILVGNVLASFLVGIMATSDTWILAVVLASGLAGGLSTFSSFAAQTVDFMRRGRIAQGLLNVLSNLAVSSTAVWLGAFVGSALLK